MQIFKAIKNYTVSSGVICRDTLQLWSTERYYLQPLFAININYRSLEKFNH